MRERHGDVLFSDDGATIDEVVVRLLDGRTLATAESCTGGLMAGRLTDRAGSSAYVLGGLVVYSNEAKTALAGVDASLIEAHGAVSPEVASALAAGARVALRRRHRHRDHGHRGSGRRDAGEAGRHGVLVASRALTTLRNGRCASRAPAETSATARPPWPSTCSGRASCSVPRSGSDPLRLFVALDLPDAVRDALAVARTPTPTSGARSSPRRSTSRSRSSAPARPPTSSSAGR